MKKILAINSGSSSFKWKLFQMPDEKVIAEGIADRVGLPDSMFEVDFGHTKYVKNLDIKDQEQAVQLLLESLKRFKIISDYSEIEGVGHRVVAGGEFFKESVIVGHEELIKIHELSEYAPLHNPAEVKGIEAFKKLLPGVPEVAVFDTSFHTSMPAVNYLYSLPYEYYRKYGARKYGAHGTSVRYVAQRAAEMMNRKPKRLKLIVLHLGSGASVTAVKNGKSFDTSMGFTPLAGITMGTRSGDVDPSLLSYLMEKLEIKHIDDMIDILNQKSGLLGISGLSPDMRDLEKTSRKHRSKLAMEIFVNRIVRYIGQYIFELKGVDGIVFTAGIGEHSPEIRKAVIKELKFYGIEIDDKENAKNGEKFISSADSKVKVMIVPTNEELMIVRDVVRLEDELQQK